MQELQLVHFSLQVVTDANIKQKELTRNLNMLGSMQTL
jgi:hypothetical protein